MSWALILLFCAGKGACVPQYVEVVGTREACMVQAQQQTNMPNAGCVPIIKN